MPVSVSYPGVYLEEIPSGVRSITGVATAVTAFVGRTRRGSDDEAKRIYSWAEFEREYGGLWKESTVSYAVNHYFANGGADAVIARATNGGAESSFAWPSSDTLQLESVDGTNYQLVVSHHPDENVTADFTIEVRSEDGATSITSYELSLDPDSDDYIETVLASGSGALIRVASGTDLPLNRPDADTYTMASGSAATPAAASTCELAVGGGGTPLILEAKTAGLAGDELSATLVPDGADGFTLTVTDGETTEEWVVTDYVTEAAAFQDNVNANSELFNVTQDGSAVPDPATSQSFENGEDAGEAVPAGATLTCTRAAGDEITIEAASVGAWGDNIQVSIDYNTKDQTDTSLFNLVAVEYDADEPTTEVRRETFRNLSVDPDSSRYAPTVVEQESDLVRLTLGTNDPRPTPVSDQALANGDDGDAVGDGDIVTALGMLEEVDLFTLLCIPPLTLDQDISLTAVGPTAISLCDERNAFFIVDAPSDWDTSSDPLDANTGLDSLGLQEKNAAIYFPRLKMPDPLKEYRLTTFAPCGVVAGIYARTDAQRGVWKAPAGLEANTRGVRELTVKLTDSQQGALNQVGVNCLRSFPVVGTVVWGARTLRGADVLADDWKYIPVRRLANYVRESLYRGTKWAVFEPNDEPLWSQLRLSIGTFMQTLFRQGAFQGKTPREAYFVKCDKETTTQADINLGIVNILVGFAPLKPAEFVIIKLQQMAGQSG